MKKVLVILLLFLIPLNVLGEEDTFDTARSSIIMDLNSGRVLYENNADEERLIASITKIMTCIIAIEEGNLNKEVKAGEEILKMYGTSIYLELNEKMKLKRFMGKRDMKIRLKFSPTVQKKNAIIMNVMAIKITCMAL